MKDILRTLKLVDAMEKKKKRKLNETAVDECGEMGSPAPVAENPGNPVTASITLNASGMEHVADLMRLMQQAGLEKSGPVAPEQMPIRADMERLRDKMNGLEGPPSEPKPQYFGVDAVTAGGDDLHSKKEPEDIRVKDGSIAHEIRHNEDWANEPEEKYGDHLDMIKRLSGGLNREKGSYSAAQPGDNAMAVEGSPKIADGDRGSFYDDEVGLHIEWEISDGEIEVAAYDDEENQIELDPRQAEIYVNQVQDEFRDAQDEYGDYEMRRRNDETVQTVKSRLLKALSEKKAKPDFLDVDKDGDKKEPMKKAVQDAKKGGSKDTDTNSKGLSANQKKLPAGLQKAIAKKKTNESVGSIDNSIKKIFGKIYNYGDAGLDYLDNNAPFYDRLATMHGGDLDQILANISDQEKMKLGREMKSVLDAMSFNLESRFNEAKKSKPDFLDVDKDGDKKEPMKKAIKDKQTKK